MRGLGEILFGKYGINLTNISYIWKIIFILLEKVEKV